MNYAEAIEYMYGLAPRGISLGLTRVNEALAQRGHPERACPAILVAGTNGKGSVSATLASVLQSAGYKVGLYTSPHLHRLVERFRIAGKAMAPREFARRVSALKPWLEDARTPKLTFFEACTVLAFEAFRDARCDIAVLEVGLGGRFDATNVVTPLVSVITRVAMDHADRLGPTLGHIAREKAGIIKPNVPVILGVREPVALRVMRARAARVRAPRFEIDRDFSAVRAGDGYRVNVRGKASSVPRFSLAGSYQADNLACALTTLSLLEERGFHISTQAVARGLRKVRWPGRLELLTGPPAVLLDAAHNPDACAALAAELERLRSAYGRVVLVFGVLGDKDHPEMLRLLRPQVDELVFTTPGSARALKASLLARRRRGHVVDDPWRAFVLARRLAGRRGLVVVAGSIFLMATVRAKLLELASDPPIAM